MKKQTFTTLGSLALLVGGAWAAKQFIRRGRYMDLRGRTILITGGSRGLGLLVAREAMRRGMKVAICARDEAELTSARDELARFGCEALAVQCDITSAPQVYGMIEGVIEHFGSIDVLVNNAGIITVAPLDDLTAEDFERAMQTHFSGPLYLSLAVLPSMRLRGRGRIVNIASIGGKMPVPHLLPYCASKFALVGLSESLRTELSQEGIYVTTVIPGLMRTGSPRNIDVRGQHTKEYAWFATADALPLISMNPRRMARRILDAAAYGDAELILPLVAKLGVLLHGVAPGLATELNALIGGFLPQPGGIGTDQAKGYESEALVPNFARRRNDQAAMANNEFAQAVVK